MLEGPHHLPCLFPQDLGAGLAVVPLIGLLESIAVAKAFGETPAARTFSSSVMHPGWAHSCSAAAFLLAFGCCHL